MRKLTVLFLALAMLVLVVPAASASIHPLRGDLEKHCGPGGVPGSEHSARSPDFCDPPGITPNGTFGPIFPHEDAVEAADHNDQAQFRPLIATICANENAANHSWKVSQEELDGFRALIEGAGFCD